MHSMATETSTKFPHNSTTSDGTCRKTSDCEAKTKEPSTYQRLNNQTTQPETLPPSRPPNRGGPKRRHQRLPCLSHAHPQRRRTTHANDCMMAQRQYPLVSLSIYTITANQLPIEKAYGRKASGLKEV